MLRYEDLTFPEIAALPRDTPWVLPLGKAPADAPFVLPTVPFGFAGPLRVPAWPRFLESLLGVLAQDGFTHVRVVESEGSVAVPSAPSLALVPIGHTEQHGYHLPLSTDTLIIDALSARAAACVERCWRLPTFPYGVSMHRREFAGTLTVDPRVFEDFWTEIVGCLHGLGLRAVYLVNGHGGNHSFLVNVSKFAGERWTDTFTATSFLHTASGPAWRQVAAERDSQMMGHACELETSYVLALRPDLVHMDRCVDEPHFVTTSEFGMDWVEEGSLIANPPWSDDTRTGSYGNPSCGTAAKGLRWLETAGLEMGRLAQQVVEQQRLRSIQRERLVRTNHDAS